MKKVAILILSLIVSVAFAKPEDRLRELVKKDVLSKMQGGKGLSESEKKEYDTLSDEVGIYTTVEISNQVMGEIQKDNAPKSAPKAEAQASKPKVDTSEINALLSPKPVAKAVASNHETKTTKQAETPAKVATPAPVVMQTPAPTPAKALPEKTVVTNDSKPETPNITVVINQPGAQPLVSTTMGQTPEAQASGAASNPNQKPVATKDGEKDKPEKDTVSNPLINKDAEKRMLKAYKDAATSAMAESELPAVTKPGLPIQGDQIYTPSPVGQGVTRPGFAVNRDSTSIVTYPVSVYDAVNIYTCVADGVGINLDESIKSKFQDVFTGDDKYFTYRVQNNRRGVFVRLKRPVPEGGSWVSSLRLYRDEDDKAYIINLIGVPCPADILRFPKQVYLTEKINRAARLDDKLKLADNEVLTPEDTIIAASNGFDSTDIYKIQVYDMVASSGAKAITLGVELDSLTDQDDGEFKVLDYHQITQIKTEFRYLDLQSKKASGIRGKKVQRFNLTVRVDKDYILGRKYIYLMYINKKKKNYEYVRIDLAQYMKSLKDRGFDL